MTLSVRLPVPLEKQLFDYCKKNGLSKTQAVQQALSRLFVQPKGQFSIDPADPLAKWVGSIQRGPSTDEHMRMTRGDNWNKP